MSGRDRLWAWIRARDGEMFTIDEASAGAGVQRQTAAVQIWRWKRAGLLQGSPHPVLRVVGKPMTQYRLAVDYGPDTPRVDGDGIIRDRQHNFDVPRAVWATFRIHRCLRRVDLMANVNSGARARYTEGSIKYYLESILIAGGYIIQTNPGCRPFEYMLAHDTGPRAPIRKMGAIWDANLDKVIRPELGETIDA